MLWLFLTTVCCSLIRGELKALQSHSGFDCQSFSLQIQCLFYRIIPRLSLFSFFYHFSDVHVCKYVRNLRNKWQATISNRHLFCPSFLQHHTLFLSEKISFEKLPFSRSVVQNHYIKIIGWPNQFLHSVNSLELLSLNVSYMFLPVPASSKA